MIRLTRKVFTDLSIWMMGLGLMIGIIFPFFALWMGIPRNFVMTPWFFLACIVAGIIVGALKHYPCTGCRWFTDEIAG